jgi:molybdopterin-synthase adenylyltransferase
VVVATVSEELAAFLQREAQGDLLPWPAQRAAAETFGLSLAAVEEACLETGLLPARYQRNRETVSLGQQLQLFRSTAVIVGCGGLGGYLVEELARLGVGRLVLIDPDVFEEHNLNRQILSSPDLLGAPKAEVAADRVRAVNPAVTPIPVRQAFSPENGRELLAGAAVALDGLDNFSARQELGRFCRELDVPLVHGAIGGWYGQVATQLDGDDITPIMCAAADVPKGVEARLGNPSFTPAVVASLQVAEACKIMLGLGNCLNRRMLSVNLLDMVFEEIGQ